MKKVLFVLFIIFNISLNLRAQEAPFRINGYIQGSTYSIVYFDKESRDFKKEIESILEQFNKSVSIYDSTSIISKVNRNVPNVQLDEYFITCFNKSLEVSKATDGAFDITVGPLVNAWGFGNKNKEKMDTAKVKAILEHVGFNKVSIKNNLLVKTDPEVIIDFNGIAQGYSVDVISNFLKSKKIENFIVEIGGEVYANGKKPNGTFWTVGVEKPNDNKDGKNDLEAIAKLENSALTTAGNYRKFYIENGIRYSHTINPKTGFPAKNTLLSASVFAKECIICDGYDTPFMVMGLEKTLVFLKKHPEIQAYLIYSDEKGDVKTFETEGLKDILTEKK
ncbi:MAG: FAD:protein FMN transferase [Bacteroidota bacterium]